MAAVRKNNKKNISGANAPAVRQEKKKFLRGIILLAVTMLFIAGTVFAIFKLKQHMFENNRHFILRRVVVKSGGYWGKSQDTSKQLHTIMGVKLNSTNLFTIDSKELRSKLRKQPNIADAQITRVLPDTLQVVIEERIPRAFIGRSNSALVIDANCMVMSTAECFGVHPHLPVINGMPHINPNPGETHLAFREALALIMTAQRYPCFSVAAISLQQADKLVMLIDYRVRSQIKRYHVTMPTGNYSEYLDTLKSAIEDARRHGNNHSRINLTFEGQVVLSR